MYNNDDILNELKSMGPALIPLQKVNVFTVPANYFEDFSREIMADINAAKPSFLPAEVINTMDVPPGYFDSLAGNILAKIKALSAPSAAEELKELSPALSATGNDNVFTAPSRYFQDLPEIILSRVQAPAKVIQMRSRSAFSRYAAAAVVTGILGLGLFSMFNKKTTEINPAPLTAAVMAEAQSIVQTNSFDKVLESVSDADIVGYLENNGQDVKAALVAAATDSKELPAADDYIMNDNTLDNFLDELNIKDYSN